MTRRQGGAIIKYKADTTKAKMLPTSVQVIGHWGRLVGSPSTVVNVGAERVRAGRPQGAAAHAGGVERGQGALAQAAAWRCCSVRADGLRVGCTDSQGFQGLTAAWGKKSGDSTAAVMTRLTVGTNMVWIMARPSAVVSTGAS